MVRLIMRIPKTKKKRLLNNLMGLNFLNLVFLEY